MSNFNTLNEVLTPKEGDYTLIRQDGVDVKIKRSNTFAEVSEILTGNGTNTSISPESLLKFFVSIQIGEIKYTQAKVAAPLHVRAKGQELNRLKYKDLFDFASSNNLIIPQSTKDANPFEKSAMYGDGDGSTTFTVPNFHQGQVLRGASNLGSFGETQEDAIRNITGSIDSRGITASDNGALVGASGALNYTKTAGSWDFVAGGGTGNYINRVILDTSKTVPTAAENRMKNSNIYIDIFTGVVA